jgi:hypothetical protein
MLNVRLLIEVDTAIRSQIEYKGDISRLVTEAIEKTDLETVQLLPIWGAKKKLTAKQSVVVLPRIMLERIRRTARERQSPISTLVNSALQYYFIHGPGRPAGYSSGKRLRPYDSMKKEEKDSAVNALETLNGAQPAPSGKMHDGSIFQYDPQSKKTIALSPRGDRHTLFVDEFGVAQRVPQK